MIGTLSSLCLPGIVLDIYVCHGEAPCLHVFVTGQVSPDLRIVLAIKLSNLLFFVNDTSPYTI